MVNVYIKERINDQITICAGGVTGNTTYLGALKLYQTALSPQASDNVMTQSIINKRTDV